MGKFDRYKEPKDWEFGGAGEQCRVLRRMDQIVRSLFGTRGIGSYGIVWSQYIPDFMSWPASAGCKMGTMSAMVVLPIEKTSGRATLRCALGNYVRSLCGEIGSLVDHCPHVFYTLRTLQGRVWWLSQGTGTREVGWLSAGKAKGVFEAHCICACSKVVHGSPSTIPIRAVYTTTQYAHTLFAHHTPNTAR